MSSALGLDSSVLSAFARAGRLDVLDRLTAGRRRVVTEAILVELDRGCAEYSSLADVRALPWLEVVTADSPHEAPTEWKKLPSGQRRIVTRSKVNTFQCQ